MTTATQTGRERETVNSWDKFLERVKSRVSINTFTTWFQPTRLNRAESDTLYIQIPSAVFRQVLTRTYGDIVKAVFHELGTPNTKVQYVCTEEEPVPAAPVVSGVKQAKLDFESSDHQLNTRYTFDSFVVGKSNEFAHAASRAVADQPSKAYNPLFLYGGVGMGKTHLMHAIGHTIKKRNPAIRLSYVSAEKFTIEVINSLPFDVAEYIARAIKSNVRELEGALTRLMAYASLTGTIVSLTTAQQVLRNIIASQEKRVTIDLIQKRVSEHFNLREQDLKVRSNTRAIAFPRQVAMYIVKQLTTASLPEIGRQVGGKHHTTVLHSINKIEELRRSA